MPRATLNIRQIAEKAGVSTSTVSRVLNSSGYVRREVREHVERVIAETGYVPSGVAKHLKSSRSHMVGIIIPRINSFASSEIIAGISIRLAEAGLVTILGNSANSPEAEMNYLGIFARQRVCGVIILATVLTERHIAAMADIGVPVIVVGQDASEHGFPSVVQDERRATRQITDYVLRSGHSRIGLIGVGEEDVQVGYERKAGWTEALAAAGIVPRESDIVFGGFDLSDGAAGIDRLVPFVDEAVPTAVLAVTDRLAIGAMSRLIERRTRVPEEVSVVGVGDIDVASVYQPRLTTVRFDYFATGAAAAGMLIDRLNGEGDGELKRVMPFELCIRNSVAERS